MATELPLEEKQDEERPRFPIASISVENFQRVVRVDADLGPGMTEVLSKMNGEGKTSWLNGTATALAGRKWLPDDPIHGDAEEARVEIEAPPYRIIRVFQKVGSGSIEIRRLDDDSEVPAPTDVLADWRSDLTYDPMRFANDMTPSQQRTTILQALNLEEQVGKLVAERKEKFAERKGVNQDVTRLKGAVSEYADLIEAPEIPSTETVIEQRKELEARRDAHDEAAGNVGAADEALASAKRDAGRLVADANADAHRAAGTAADALNNAQASAAMLLGDANGALTDARAAVAAAEAQVESAKQDGAGLVTRANEGIAAAQTTAGASVKKAEGEGNELRAKATEVLAATEKAAESAPDRPADKAFADLDEQLTDAADKAADLARWEQAVKVRGELAGEQEKSKGLTQALADIDAQEIALINEAGLPLPELGITGDGVTFNDRPFAQADDAQKMRSGFAVALASDPQLRIALIRNGSQLDKKNRALLHDIALEFDAQVLVERLDEHAEPGEAVVVIEDGRRVGAESADQEGK